MSPLWRRSALAALLGCGVWAGLARADEWVHPWHYPGGATFAPPGAPPVDNTHSSHPLQDWWQRGRPMACWSSFNGYGCGSLRAECDFVFGSCRTFFGEPCLKGPPPSPLPPWVQLGPTHPAPGGGANSRPGDCNCR